MTESKFNKRKLVASILTVCFVAHQSLMLNAIATEITGVTGNNGIYNIDPTATNGATGFRQYDKFNLTEGDIANLIFKYGEKNIERFVNLVDGRININGIVNSMRDGNFYNGQAVFVSPNGMVVGASGVLNVGSLAVYTPNSNDYNNYKENFLIRSIDTVKQGNADVTINGKVLTRDNIEILAKTASLGADSALISGVANTSALTSMKQANNLFNQLVNTDATNANSFSTENGQIVIKTENPSGGIIANGTVKNFGEGNVTLTNDGSKGIRVNGTIENANGNTLITNNDGALNVAGKINNKGNITMTNNSSDGLAVNGQLKNKDGNILLTNNAGKMTISGSTDNKNGNTILKNEAGELNILGDVANNGGRVSVTNNGTKLTLANTGKISNNGSTVLLNNGAQGTNLAGEIAVNDANLLVQNEAGDLNMSGQTSNNNGDIRILNNGNKLSIASTGKISNNQKTEVLNNGSNGLRLEVN